MRRQHLAIALVALIAVACAYLLGRVQGTDADVSTSSTGVEDASAKAPAKAFATTPLRNGAMLPPRDARLKDVFSDLQARANAGDVAAATRLYRDLSLCSRFRGIGWANARLADELLSERVDTMEPEQLGNYRAQLEAVESREQNTQKFRDLCDGASDAMLDSLVPNLRKAAQLGEESARACYLSVGPNYDASSLISHPEWLGAYRNSVSSLIDAGIAAGDSRIVNIVRDAYQPGSKTMLSGVLGSDPYQHYRYLKLYRLDAEPDATGNLDRQLAAAAAQLEPEQRAEADNWAETTFRQNFNRSDLTQPSVEGWDPCVFPYE